MKLTIRLKLLIGFTLLLTLSSLVQGFSFLITKQYVSSQINNFQQVQAEKGSSEIQTFFTNLSITSFGLEKVYKKTEKDLAPTANYVLKNNNYIKKIAILSPLGREITKFDTFGQVAQDELTYEVYSDPFKSAVSGSTAISKVYYIEQGLGPRVDLFSPIFGDKNDVIAVIKMQINLDQLRTDLADIRLGENGYIYIVDNEGRLIAHPSETFVLERPNLSSRKVISNASANIQSTSQDEQYRNEKNISVVAKAIKVPGYNWVAIFEQPETEAYGFLTFIRNIFIITLFGSSLFLLLIALFLSENLTRPIRKLQQSAQQIEKGQLEKTPIIRSGDEIESLSHSFASLIDQLMQKEHSLEKTGTQLGEANNRLKELDRMKDEFVSLAAHELRTPMTSIKSYLWMALSGQGGELTEKQKYYLQRATKSADRLIKLVNDMLNISLIESGRLTIQIKSVDMIELVSEAIEEINPKAKELEVGIEISGQESIPQVLADPDKIKEVIINLIGNSLKFTPKEGKITVSFAQKDNMLETTIRDTGSGINPEDISKLFHKFGMLPGTYASNQPTSGTGLGLYMCKSIVELQGGKIWVTSEGKGKGASFFFTLKIFNQVDLDKFNEKYKAQPQSNIDLIHQKII